MKKLNVILSGVLTVALSACTLYMDDFEEGRVLRTGTGYLEPETVTLPNDEGSITYQYSQNTIPINDEVESYIVKVESDTILYFEDGTPEELLPEVGEMMTCSFRDRFPKAFCHKCIARTEQNGLYRCTFTKCSFKDAFAKLKISAHPQNLIPADGAQPITKEELDDVMKDYVDVEEPASSDARNEAPSVTRGSFDTGKRTFTGVKDTIGNISLSASAGSFVGLTGTATIGYSLGGYYDFEYDSDTDKLYEEYGLMGNLDLNFSVTASAGVKIQSPIAIPMYGFKVDLIVVGAELGFTCNPYLDIQHETSADFQFSVGFDVGVAYVQNGKDSKGTFTTKRNKIKKKRGMPAFRFMPRNFDAHAQKLTLHVTGGVDYRFGLGADVIGTGGDLAAGVEVYQEFNQTVDTGEFESVEDFQKKNDYMPTYTKFYAEGAVKLLGTEFPIRVESKPFPGGNVRIPLMPVYKDGSAYFYCSDQQVPQTYKMNIELDELGWLGYWWVYLPKARVYFRDADKSQPEEVFDLKWEEGSGMKKMSATVRSNKLVNNIHYVAQFAMVHSLPNGRSFTVPMAEVPFITEFPVMEIDKDDIRLTQTLTPQNATAQELSNPTIIANRDGTLAWVRNGKAYRYRFKIDVPVAIEAPRLMKSWGIHMNDKFGTPSEFTHTESSTDEIISRVVRMTWYTNDTKVWLSFQPFAICTDAHGKSSGRKNFKSVDMEFEYYNLLDRQYSITDKTPDYEFARTVTRSSADTAAPSQNLPYGDRAVLGDIEFLER